MTRLLRLIVISITIVLTTGWVYGDRDTTENVALLALFDSEGSKLKKEWNPKEIISTQRYKIKGIEFNDQDKITGIVLPHKNLQGELPPELKRLPELTVLDLSHNNLKGEIPSWIGKLSNLKILNLSSNNFEGVIPSWLGALPNLEELHLNDNMLKGPIPSKLGKLSGLKKLKLHRNMLTGDIPVELAKLTKLESKGLNLDWNGLSTENVNLRNFLLKHQEGDWENTQPLKAPLDIRFIDSTNNTITISWKSPRYKGAAATYEVQYWPEGEQPLMKFKPTDKAETTVIDLKPRTTYFFKIRCITVTPGKNKNKIAGKFSTVSSGKTRGVFIRGTIKRRDGKGFAGVRLKVSNIDGTFITDNDGKYELNVTPGWSGEVIPELEDYTFLPPKREYSIPVQADIDEHDYTIKTNITIEGKVTLGTKAVKGVRINFHPEKKTEKNPQNKNNDEKTEAISAITDDEGKYKMEFNYRWVGTVEPKKGVCEFKPNGLPNFEIKSQEIEDFIIKSRIIKGLVRRRGKKTIDSLELEFSDLEKYELEEMNTVTTDAKGEYTHDVPIKWSGNVNAAPKSKYTLYPSKIYIEAEEINFPVKADFQAEPNFHFFILGTVNFMLPSDTYFDDVYGIGSMYLELSAGYKFNRYVYIWGGFGSFSNNGHTTSDEASTTARWRQQNLSLGIGYYKNVSLLFDWKLSGGLMWVRYNEKSMGNDITADTWGARIDGAAIFKITDRWFMEISVGYLYSEDSIDNARIKVGGAKTGVSVGLRF